MQIHFLSRNPVYAANSLPTMHFYSPIKEGMYILAAAIRKLFSEDELDVMIDEGLKLHKPYLTKHDKALVKWATYSQANYKWLYYFTLHSTVLYHRATGYVSPYATVVPGYSPRKIDIASKFELLDDMGLTEPSFIFPEYLDDALTANHALYSKGTSTVAMLRYYYNAHCRNTVAWLDDEAPEWYFDKDTWLELKKLVQKPNKDPELFEFMQDTLYDDVSFQALDQDTCRLIADEAATFITI